MAFKKGGLGRGLDSLFNENSTEKESTVTVDINDISPNRNQPRKVFDEELLNELSESIKEHGLIQPIVVRPDSMGGYVIIAGERRWRASRMAELKEVPVVIKDVTETEADYLSLVENLQREDLNPLEEAKGYKALMDSYGLTQAEVAQKVSKSRSAVANFLRILSLPEKMLDALSEGKISYGQARTLLSADNEEKRENMFRLALLGVSVRELERMAEKKPEKKKEEVKNKFYTEVSLALKNELHRKVSVKSSGNGRGTLTVEFYSDKELSEFAEKLAEKK